MVSIDYKLKQALKESFLKDHKSQWYNLRPILGCANWAIFYILLGARATGKS